jgi:twitching motility protein PilJ
MNSKQNVPSASQPGGRIVVAAGAVLALAILAFVWNLYVILRDAGRDAGYQRVVSQVRLVSQRVETGARQSVAGDSEAPVRLGNSRAELEGALKELTLGTETLPSPAELLGDDLNRLRTVWGEIDPAASTIVAKKDSIRFVGETARALEEAIPRLQEKASRVVELLAGAGLPARTVAQAERQSWLAERVARNVDRMLAGGSEATEAAEQVSRDIREFQRVLAELQGLPQVASNADALANLREIGTLFEPVGERREQIANAAPDLVQAREAADVIQRNAPAILAATSGVSERIANFGSQRALNTTTALGFGALVVVALIALGVQSMRNTRRRLAQTAEANDRNQQAILRLLDELAGLADGDLTTTATVTEDFTGAIADAINYTIDQLRLIVSSINETSRNVSQAAEDTQATALHLAEAAEHQAQEIAGASSAVNEMAITIDQVSSNAAESAAVADRSVALAKTGSQVVGNTIGGMDTIREQIQETAKRIKRLGESSQEIGDIVSLINDISDQTNILALNAAIQASMAGDAGRGFAVVADEVQRLAERSGAATKQIEALVKTIQSDTHEAVMSMEQTTAEVVRGARLAEDAGVALEEIESVSKNLASLIQNISNAARQQASSAGHISNTMNIIQEITSQTSAGTTATAQSIGKLATMTNDLRNSVAGFKLPPDTTRSGRGGR